MSVILNSMSDKKSKDYTFFKKDWGDQATYTGMTRKTAYLSGFVAFGLGYYDGFFGPGAGSFLIFAFLMIGFDFLQAAGNAKVLNLSSNAAALIVFGLLDSIHYGYGLVMSVGMIVGAIIGSRFAISQGTAYVRPLFMAVTTLLISKQLWDMLR